LDTNKPEEKVLLENILKSLPCDQDWDEGVPREKSLKEAGEKRYLYQSTLLTERKLSTYDSNRLTAGVDSGDKKVLQQMTDKEPASGSCTVKVEYPLCQLEGEAECAEVCQSEAGKACFHPSRPGC